MRTATSFLITKLDHIHKNNILKNQLIDDLYIKKNYSRFQDNKKYKLVSDIEQMITVGSTLIGFLYKASEEEFGFGFFVENNEDHLIVKLVFDDHLGYHLNTFGVLP